MKTTSLPKTLILTALLFVLSAVPALAQETNQPHEGFYFQNGDNVTISQTINGDAFVSGGSVTFEGNVNGDLFVAGGMVTVRGTISDDLRVAGGFVTIDGQIGKNVLAAGGNIKITKNAEIGGSILALGGNTVLEGKINKDAYIYGETARILGQIGGQTKATVSKLDIGETAVLQGNLNYTAPTPAAIAQQASISGTVKRVAPPVVAPSTPPARPRIAFGFTIFSYLSMLIIGLIFAKLAPRQAKALAELVGERPGKNLLWGFLFLITAPIAIFFLLISIIGLPLALLGGGVYAVMIVLTTLTTSFWLGRRLFKVFDLQKNLYLQLAAGLLVVQLVFTLPAVGVFARFLSILVGLGAEIALTREGLKRLGSGE
jgi:cytoskeletal protein CcmA (bactofilin family)